MRLVAMHSVPLLLLVIGIIIYEPHTYVIWLSPPGPIDHPGLGGHLTLICGSGSVVCATKHSSIEPICSVIIRHLYSLLFMVIWVPFSALKLMGCFI